MIHNMPYSEHGRQEHERIFGRTVTFKMHIKKRDVKNYFTDEELEHVMPRATA